MILEADDQTCSTIGAEGGAAPTDEAQPICTYFSQTMFANMDKLPDFISSGDNKCDAPPPPSPPRRRRARRAAAPPPPAPLSLAAPFTFHPPPSTNYALCTSHARGAHRAHHHHARTHAATTHVPRSRPRAASFTFNNYAPLLIVILCGCTYLNLFSNMAACCMRCVPCINAQSNSFSFDEDFSDTRIDHGAQILTRERQAMAEGSPLGANLQLLSGATSDGEEASKASARQAPSSASRNLNRWNHLQEDNL